jgi:L-iditol 2-dehydrogenase
LVEPLAVALHVLRRSGFRAGDRARVYGAGPIGILVAFWLQVFGAEDIVLADIREESTLLARSLGLPAVNVSSIGRDWAESAHVVVEAAGAAPALCDAILTARRKGKVVVVGRSPSDTTIPHDLFEKLMRKELLLVGCWGYDLRGEESFLLKVLSERGDFLEGLITHEVTLADAPSVLRRMIENDFHYCKLLITLA